MGGRAWPPPTWPAQSPRCAHRAYPSASAREPGSSPTRCGDWPSVAEWTLLPDFVSINFDEEGAVELASFFLRRHVALEAGVANPFAAEQLVRSGLADRCLRIMFEPREQDRG